METNEFGQNGHPKFKCLICHYYTCKKNHFNRHLQTEKHKQRSILQNNTDLGQKGATFECECGKNYKHNSSLYNHKKICQYQQNQLTITNQQNLENQNEEKIDYNKIIHELINQNNTLQNTIKELIPKIGNNNNTTNQNFNISLFLNEKCPNALTIEQFVKQIEVSIKDLLFTKQKGLINGVSNIFIENLNKLPLVQRPIWCGDKKRKKIYVKGDKWSEDLENQKTKKAINDISFIQSKNINQFIKQNTNWMQNDNLKNEYISIVKNATQSISNKEDNVINQIVDTIYIDQNNKI
jgi:hypothetical protein